MENASQTNSNNNNFANEDDVLSIQSMERLNQVLDRISLLPCKRLDQRNEDSAEFAKLLVIALRFSLLGCGYHEMGTDCLRRIVFLKGCVKTQKVMKHAIQMKSVVNVMMAIVSVSNDSIVLNNLENENSEIQSQNQNALLFDHLSIIKSKLNKYAAILRKSSLVRHNDTECSLAYEELIIGLIVMCATAWMSNMANTLVEFLTMQDKELSYDLNDSERSLANWGVLRGLMMANTRYCAPLISMTNGYELNQIIERLSQEIHSQTLMSREQSINQNE